MKPYMSYKCCKDCTRRPVNPREKCKYGWHVFGPSKERDMCIFIRKEVKDGLVMEWNALNYPVDDVISAIENGEKNIGMRDYYHCPITAI